MDSRIIDYEEETEVTEEDFVVLDNEQDRPVKISAKRFIQEVTIDGE